MDSESAFILFCIIVAIVGLSSAYSQNEKRKSSWKKLETPKRKKKDSSKKRKPSKKKKVSKSNAFTADLTFNETQGPIGSYVTGTCRGYNLTLDSHTIFPAKTYQVYTRFRLSAIAPSNNSGLVKIQQVDPTEITPEYVTNMLWRPSSITMLRGEIRIKERAREICLEQRGIIEDVNHIRRLFDWLCNLADSYDEVLALGKDAEPAVGAIAQSRSNFLRPVASQLLKDMSKFNTNVKNQNNPDDEKG
jgi:hypothetical protein